MSKYRVQILPIGNYVEAEMQDDSMQHPYSGASYMLLKTRQGLGVLAHHCNLATAHWIGKSLTNEEYTQAKAAFSQGGNYDNTERLLSERGLHISA